MTKIDNTMVEAIALGSPSGKISRRALKNAQERLRKELFGEQGLEAPKHEQPTQKERLLRQAKELRELAAKGMKPKAYLRKAKELEEQASKL